MLAMSPDRTGRARRPVVGGGAREGRSRFRDTGRGREGRSMMGTAAREGFSDSARRRMGRCAGKGNSS